MSLQEIMIHPDKLVSFSSCVKTYAFQLYLNRFTLMGGDVCLSVKQVYRKAKRYVGLQIDHNENIGNKLDDILSEGNGSW